MNAHATSRYLGRRYGFTVTSKWVADNDDGLRISLTVEQRVNASDPDDACSDGTSLAASAVELAFPESAGWSVDSAGDPEVEPDGDDRDDR